jgi:hypothetical protein
MIGKVIFMREKLIPKGGQRKGILMKEKEKTMLSL